MSTALWRYRLLLTPRYTERMIPIFLLTTRGLEPLCAHEIAALPGLRIQESGYRRISATCAALDPLLGLRTVDDAFVQVAIWDSITHTRAALAEFTAWSAALDLERAASAVRTVRPFSKTPTYAISASFVGKRNYSVDEIKAAVSAGIAQRLPRWRYSDDDGSAEAHLRLFIDHETAYVGMRITRRPLHERPYKSAHTPGSLKPQIAAALARFAGAQHGMTIGDPFCGAGTILLEAAFYGARAIGGDRDPAAVSAATDNGAPSVSLWDARQLPLARASLDAVISNMPWGKQIDLDDPARLYADAFAEMRRAVRPGGVMVLLTPLADLLPPPAESFEISVFGQNPRVLMYRRDGK
ncbi:MAG: methyltransferase domain-containing protein [Anaerolineae bacterium]